MFLPLQRKGLHISDDGVRNHGFLHLPAEQPWNSEQDPGLEWLIQLQSHSVVSEQPHLYLLARLRYAVVLTNPSQTSVLSRRPIDKLLIQEKFASVIGTNHNINFMWYVYTGLITQVNAFILLFRHQTSPDRLDINNELFKL